jgi:Ser/Thr protein kinase RdoA (MazF antagonist)
MWTRSPVRGVGDLDAIGPDLAALLRESGHRVAEIAVVSARGVPPRPTAFRLITADGIHLKGTCLASPEQAATSERLSRHLRADAVVPVIARSGSAVLQRWIDGEPLRVRSCPAAVMRACGSLQGAIHRRELAGVADLDAPGDAPWRPRLVARLEELVAAGAVCQADAAAAVALADRYAPRTIGRGIIVGDLCPDNIVRDRDGRLHVVDVESLTIGPTAYDLARTWYRWPMTTAETAAFLHGYAEHADPSDYLAHFPHWAVVALVNGARYRRRMRPDTAVEPLRRLRLLLADPEPAARVPAI